MGSRPEDTVKELIDCVQSALEGSISPERVRDIVEHAINSMDDGVSEEEDTRESYTEEDFAENIDFDPTGELEVKHRREWMQRNWGRH